MSRRLEGYLLIDHRASPGLTEAQARAAGYDPRLCGEGKQFEADTLTCAHCRGVQIKNPSRTRDRAHCRKCDRYLCDHCGLAATMPDYIHMPFSESM